MPTIEFKCLHTHTQKVNMWGDGCFNSFDSGNPFTMCTYIKSSHCTLLQFCLLVIPQGKSEKKKRIGENVLAEVTNASWQDLVNFLSVVPNKWDRYFVLLILSIML